MGLIADSTVSQNHASKATMVRGLSFFPAVTYAASSAKTTISHINETVKI